MDAELVEEIDKAVDAIAYSQEGVQAFSLLAQAQGTELERVNEVLQKIGILTVAEIQNVNALSDIPGGDPRFYARVSLLWAKGYTLEESAEKLGLPVPVVQDFWDGVGFDTAEIIHPRTIISDQDNNLETYLQDLGKDEPHVIMGTTPSGPLHLANVYTMINGVARVSGVAQGLGMTPRFTLAVNDNYIIFLDEFVDLANKIFNLRKFARDLSDTFGVSVTPHSASRMMQEPNFKYLLREAYPGFDPDSVPHYWLALTSLMHLRDQYLDVDVHIVGDDLVHQERLDLFEPYRRPVAFFYRTGTVYGLDGQEMHNSDGNVIPVTTLIRNPNWMNDVLALGDLPSTLVGPFDYENVVPGLDMSSAYVENFRNSPDQLPIVLEVEGWVGLTDFCFES